MSLQNQDLLRKTKTKIRYKIKTSYANAKPKLYMRLQEQDLIYKTKTRTTLKESKTKTKTTYETPKPWTSHGKLRLCLDLGPKPHVQK